MAKKPKPTYLHGCPGCRFLGTDDPKLPEEQGSSVVDMYVHSENDHHVLWRRHGDDDEDVESIYFTPTGSAIAHIDPAWMPLIKRICH